MLRMIAKSRRGKKQLNRHGNVWVPIATEQNVPCLGMAPGIKLMSVKDRATFWMKVMNDENLQPVERLDNFGRPMRGKTQVSLAELIAQGQKQMGVIEAVTREVEEQTLHGTVVKKSDGTERVISEYQTTGVRSGRFSASGEPNQSHMPNDHSADEQAAEQATASGAA